MSYEIPYCNGGDCCKFYRRKSMSNTSEVNVVKIEEVTPHPNADKLELTMVGGYQMVIGKGQFKTGDLAVFIQSDCVVPYTTSDGGGYLMKVEFDRENTEADTTAAPRRKYPKSLRGRFYRAIRKLGGCHA